ncbi:MAG: DUF6482 family protein [Vibrio anguillarum]|uniref:Na(+)-translocating NADH-quinone reductase subunit B n=1 Tax=Vibrio marisflavi CECT 7928 TaxID=634439 RepID=A0ABN8DYM9_9VIBR|nr:DUF6482 family protein [Vibrio marisflavi]MDT3848606.1 DUF6482 family protein [Vibrio anguillarum]CAH0536631.1 hypothetical protein VMF7928_00585 [Vibrio marisflavi CECT 7928]
MELQIESLEGGIYLAYSVEGKEKVLLRGGNHDPLKFSSLCQAKEHFKGQQYQSACLIHLSAYDEMCGENIVSGIPLKTDLKWY